MPTEKLQKIDQLIDFNELRNRHCIKRYCPVCGAEFEAIRVTKRLCSNRCNVRLFRERQKVKAELIERAAQAQ